MASPPSSPPQAKKPKLADEDDNLEQTPELQHQEQKQLRPPLPPLSPTTNPNKYKRRKIALFFGYCGYGYQGMQKNPGAKTIEAELEEALFLSWAVSESDRGNPRKSDWARSARTDKGVSAVGQVVSGRFFVDPPGLVERINRNLDPQIRVFGFRRVTGSFNAKKFCDRRRYVYLLPVFALDPERHCEIGAGGRVCEECLVNGYDMEVITRRGVRLSEIEERSDLGIGSGELEVVDDKSVILAETTLESDFSSKGQNSELAIGGHVMESGLDGACESEGGNGCFEEQNGNEMSDGHQNGKIAISDSEASEVVVKEEEVVTPLVPCRNLEKTTGVISSKLQYDDNTKNRLNDVLKRYVGTHNFHNFTSRTKAEDPSAQRYIISFNANSVVDIEGIEFVKCEVVGQSFMLHQIRKMIGLAVAIMRNCASESLMDSALSKDAKVDVPTAPETGLYLDECLFTSYNKKWKDSHELLSMESFAEQADDFKMKYIYSRIASMERKEGAVALWLHTLHHHRYLHTEAESFCSSVKSR